MIGPSLSALLLGSQLIAVADTVPKLDVARSCRAAAMVPPGNMDSCMKDERSAQSALSGSWTKFAKGDRAACTQQATVVGLPVASSTTSMLCPSVQNPRCRPSGEKNGQKLPRLWGTGVAVAPSKEYSHSCDA